MMHGTQKSDSPIVAVKPANKTEHLVAGADAESVEPRGGAKGNASQPRTCRTQSRESVFQRLDRVRQAARQRKKEKFTALMHLVDVELLRQSYFWLQKSAAADGEGVAEPFGMLFRAFLDAYTTARADAELGAVLAHELAHLEACDARPLRRLRPGPGGQLDQRADPPPLCRSQCPWSRPQHRMLARRNTGRRAVRRDTRRGLLR